MKFLFSLIFSTLAALQGEAQRSFNLQNYGCVGDAKTVCTKGFQAAIDACNKNGGGDVIVPPGIFLTGTVHLKSNVHLYLQSGAVLRGSANLNDYEEFYAGAPYNHVHKGMLFTENAENVMISGTGHIDGNGDNFFELNKAKRLREADTKYTRQKDSFRMVKEGIGDGPVVPKDRPYQMFVFSNCKRITIKDIFISGAPFWCMHFADCDAVHVSGARLWNSMLVPNADGIDITSCNNVIIESCDIRTGDDAIAITGFNHHFEIPGFSHTLHSSGNIIVSNCNLQSSSSGIRIGFLDQNSIKNIHVSNVNITNSTRGIGIFLRDEGSLENITFSNINIETHLRTGDWWGNAEPIHISAVRGKDSVKLGKIKHLLFENIICKGESGMIIYGSDESIIEDILFSHVRFELADSKLNEVAGGNIDLRGSSLQKSLFERDIPGLYAQYIKRLRINDFQLEWTGMPMPYFTNGIEVKFFEDVEIRDFEGTASPINKSAHKIYAYEGKGFQTNDSTDVLLQNVK